MCSAEPSSALRAASRIRREGPSKLVYRPMRMFHSGLTLAEAFRHWVMTVGAGLLGGLALSGLCLWLF
jgi:hypothetical protein